MNCCPECEANFGQFISVIDIEEWYCPSCFAMLDTWWELKDLSWTSPGDPLPPFDPDNRMVAWKTLTKEHKICCDRTTCRCLDKDYMPVSKLSFFLNSNDIKPVEDIYDCNDSHNDCRACLNYGTFKCIPFRNWIRYANKYGFYPPKIDLCIDFEEDIEYCQQASVNVDAVHKRIQDNMYYSSDVGSN